MAKKKKKVMRKVSKKERCSMNGHCKGVLFMKLSSMAVILFLISVWPAAMDLVHSIHWGWFLGATILFWLIAWNTHCKK